MKKGICMAICLMLIFATGCGESQRKVIDLSGEELSGSAVQTEKKDEKKDFSASEVVEGIEESQQEEYQPTLPEGQALEYQIERVDRSVYDDMGKLRLEIYMDYPVISGLDAVANKINEYYNKKGQYFLAEPSYIDSEDTLEQARERSATYMDKTECQVTENTSRYLSVCNAAVWYAGGVYNCNRGGETFDVLTGDLVALTDLFPEMTEDSLRDYLATKVVEYIQTENDMGWIDEAEAYIRTDDILNRGFYLENGTIYIVYPCYEISYGGESRSVPVGNYR